MYVYIIHVSASVPAVCECKSASAHEAGWQANEHNMCRLWQESKQWRDYCEVPSLLMKSARQLQGAAVAALGTP